MYLEFTMFVAFVFFVILDVRCRQIKAYWFAGLGIFVICYKIIFEFNSLGSDVLMFAASAIFVLIAFASRLFGTADLCGILVLSFAVPSFGAIPVGIPLLILTLFFQNWAIMISNISYNVSDLVKNKTLFEDMPNTHSTTSKLYHLKNLYWLFLARRKRPRDQFVLSAQRIDTNGTVWLSVKRNNKLLPDTKYVFSAHPQFVYSTISYCTLWFWSLSI